MSFSHNPINKTKAKNLEMLPVLYISLARSCLSLGAPNKPVRTGLTD